MRTSARAARSAPGCFACCSAQSSLREDHPLHVLGGRELLVDNRAGLLERHDTRRQPAQALQALVDGGFRHAEVAGGVGLGVAVLQVLAQVGVEDLRASHVGS
jgi:hypothetical protein